MDKNLVVKNSDFEKASLSEIEKFFINFSKKIYPSLENFLVFLQLVVVA